MAFNSHLSAHWSLWSLPHVSSSVNSKTNWFPKDLRAICFCWDSKYFTHLQIPEKIREHLEITSPILDYLWWANLLTSLLISHLIRSNPHVNPASVLAAAFAFFPQRLGGPEDALPAEVVTGAMRSRVKSVKSLAAPAIKSSSAACSASKATDWSAFLEALSSKPSWSNCCKASPRVGSFHMEFWRLSAPSWCVDCNLDSSLERRGSSGSVNVCHCFFICMLVG